MMDRNGVLDLSRDLGRELGRNDDQMVVDLMVVSRDLMVVSREAMMMELTSSTLASSWPPYNSFPSLPSLQL